jgi:hypothetical protein
MDTNRHQFPEKEATTDCTDKTIRYPPKTPKDAKGSESVVGQFFSIILRVSRTTLVYPYPFHSRNLWFNCQKKRERS